MSTDPPMACSLSAGDLTVRLAEIAALGRQALLGVRDDGTRVELRFSPGAGVRARVEAIVAAESQCCAFLTMRVREATGAIVVTIDAPAGAEPVLADLASAFRV